ncbi:MAG TPA: hypothetical protein VHT27_02965 [Solirubrobacteraceae bacterium]|jgi:hypothetical protein|nr:hypothetical protein [Solirubrobacteraceae bacterium]
MGGLLIIGLLIVLIVKLWPFLLAGAGMTALWLCVVSPARDRAAFEQRDRLRHELARREIDRVAFETSQAMVRAASNAPVVVDAEVLDD